ncbi:hypothetical protein [Salisediminibacterium halotolerans]|uniref:Polymer-forming protein n=1 Tax=Salisediminibacterium halotolerans TaxID=517425 RepID=A0A1H9TA80_9BACI|nr:hypothetical protein [Salisediminibacterium haloalkalitolerans]SER94036.1 hypothetical protein SAMN05444126_10958 [Salisediminibacterium haloalkalitolerans]
MKRTGLKAMLAGLSLTVIAACGANEEATESPDNNADDNAANENNIEENNNNADDNENNEENDGETGPTQSPVADEDDLLDAVGEDGAWILTFEEDVSVDEELVLEGDQENDGEPARKVALYDQEDNTYELTAPSMTIMNENALIQGGTFIGDVYVEANDFTLNDATIDGNLYFADEEYEESAEIDGEVTGDTEVEE